MAIKSATCPNCGASLDLDDRLEKGICSHCDSVIIIDDAIQKFKIEVNGKVEHVGISSAENDIKYANVCLDSGDYTSALAKFKQSLEKDPHNFDGWYGCLKAMTNNLSNFNYRDSTFSDKIFSFDSILKNALTYAAPNKRKVILDTLKNTIANQRITLHEDANTRYRTYKESTQNSINSRRRVSLILGIITGFLLTINIIGAMILDQVYGIQLLTGLINLIFFILFFNNIKKTPSQAKLNKSKLEDFLKFHAGAFERLDEIEELISSISN